MYRTSHRTRQGHRTSRCTGARTRTGRRSTPGSYRRSHRCPRSRLDRRSFHRTAERRRMLRPSTPHWHRTCRRFHRSHRRHRSCLNSLERTARRTDPRSSTWCRCRIHHSSRHSRRGRRPFPHTGACTAPARRHRASWWWSRSTSRTGRDCWALPRDRTRAEGNQTGRQSELGRETWGASRLEIWKRPPQERSHPPAPIFCALALTVRPDVGPLVQSGGWMRTRVPVPRVARGTPTRRRRIEAARRAGRGCPPSPARSGPSRTRRRTTDSSPDPLR